MPDIICTTVYQFPELSDAAKEKARSWYREAAFHDDWWDAVYDDFERICDILGVSLKTRPVRLMGGGTRQKPCIWFSGFSSQGDGASFEATAQHAKGATREIRAYAPKDQALHNIADRFQAAQRQNFYQLSANVTHRGRYYHEYCMTIDVSRDSPTG
ncbi:MAG: antitoxin of toxin-antitoxin stability system, partial [bacterium]